ADKEREATDGHDGTWVAHPGLVPVALEAFNERMPGANQIDRKREDIHVTGTELITFPDGRGDITEAGLRTNVSVGIQYIASWLAGSGAVPIFNLMEDAATAEISRSQVWQWIRNPDGVLNDGRKVSVDLFRAIMAEELAKIKATVGDAQYAAVPYQEASALFDRITTDDAFVDFLTLPGYALLD
ncbi:MAG: malate synthase A, partial [Chloroflexota bacterium]|nr:malate synthase A [Chloroflexota bacterium]